MKHSVIAVFLACIACQASCLPADTRPEPGRVNVTAKLPDDLQNDKLEFVSDDGWTITMNEFLVSIGNVKLVGKGCSPYSEANYQRILDMRQPGFQKIAEVWGLNDCGIDYVVKIPEPDSVLGTGVTEAERSFMVDGFSMQPYAAGATMSKGTGLIVRGTAQKDSIKVTFDWNFSMAVYFFGCQRRFDNGVYEGPLQGLNGGATVDVSITIDPRNLFRTSLYASDEPAVETEATVSLVQLIADADLKNGNADGRVDIEELIATPYLEHDTDVAAVIYLFSFPSIFLYDEDGHCDRHGG